MACAILECYVCGTDRHFGILQIAFRRRHRQNWGRAPAHHRPRLFWRRKQRVHWFATSDGTRKNSLSRQVHLHDTLRVAPASTSSPIMYWQNWNEGWCALALEKIQSAPPMIHQLAGTFWVKQFSRIAVSSGWCGLFLDVRTPTPHR